VVALRRVITSLVSERREIRFLAQRQPNVRRGPRASGSRRPSPQAGVYGYLLGGLGYALLGSSRQLAIKPTSAISLMIAGTVGAMADGDAQRYTQMAAPGFPNTDAAT
jgi:hypothetical protein